MSASNLKSIRVLLGLLIVMLFVARSAKAQIKIDFDEFGKGTATNPNGLVTPLPPVFGAPDPVDPGAPPTLSYNLAAVFPGQVPQDGDIELFEPGSPTNLLSDLLRWSHGLLFVYSDKPEAGDPNPAPADVGLSTIRQQPLLSFVETGTETTTNGLFNYTPFPGQPGAFNAAAGPVVYNFTSDSAVPEPASFALVTLGVGVLLLRRPKRP